MCQNVGSYVSGKKKITSVSKYGKICKFGLKWTSMPFKNLFSDFFYRLSVSFNTAETSSFAHPVLIPGYQKLCWSKVVMDWKTSVSTYLM
jgi:hypothetical protein